jgi:phosphatidylserine/phosphatidylglycerophosphate/cardiolipin synthase-like enzyme
MMVGEPMQPTRLLWARGPLGAHGDELLWAALIECRCFEGELQMLEPHALSQFLCELWRADDEHRPPERLVWTLPEALHVEGVNVDGYVREAVRLASGAKQRLLVVAPYLEPRGLGLLQAPLLDALHRGAEVALLTHDAQNLASLAATALEPLRRESRSFAGTFLVYSAAPTAGVLLHLKVVVADGAEAVVGSANVTGKGFGKNLEAGALLGKDAAAEIERVVRAVIHQGLALPVFVHT